MLGSDLRGPLVFWGPLTHRVAFVVNDDEERP